MPSDKPSPPNRSIAHLTLEEYRTIVEHAHEGMWTIDTAGVTQFVNPRMAQMLGYVPDEMVGSSVYDFMYETDRDEARGHHATRWRGISERYEFRFQRRDGSELWTMVSATPLRNENEEIIGGLDLVTDITAAKQAKETLRESEERYREFVDRATFGIYRSTVEGRFASVNPALVRMLGYGSEQELYDLDMANDLYVDPNDRALLMESYRDADRVEELLVRWRRKDGELITVRLNGIALRDDSGELIGFDIVAEDVTQQRETEMQLRQAQKMQAVGRLTGGIAHDFNNVLTAILGSAELLRQDLHQSASPEVLDGVETIVSASQRAARMVRKLMAFSRQEQLVRKIIDLGETCRETLELLRRLLPESVALKADLDETVLVKADATAIQQVLMNLAANSSDAIGSRNGAFRIKLSIVRVPRQNGAEEYARLAVSDDGDGIDTQTMRSIFEPFFTTKPRGEGTGLGLAHVHGTMQQHGGFVQVDSAVGEGTTFGLYFPIVTPAEADGAEAAPVDMLEQVLVVEDDAEVLALAKVGLERRGYRVITAADGVEALSALADRNGAVDLVVTDAVMPRMTGPELFDRVAAGGDGPKFLFMSGYAQRDSQGASLFGGTHAFLRKPWTIEELVRKVREVLDT